MRTFKLEADEFTITRGKAELKLSDAFKKWSKEDAWDLISTPWVSEFEITHRDNPDFKAYFEGSVDTATFIEGVPTITIGICRPENPAILTARNRAVFWKPKIRPRNMDYSH